MTRLSAISIVFVVALALAGVASYLVYQFLSKQESKQHQDVPVFVAARDIPVGTKLDSSNLKLSSWPKANLPPQGFFPETSKAEGRVAVRQISTGDIVTESKLMPINRAEMGGVMTYIVPQGHRAVTVAVNEVAGVAGFITPGSRVDVVLTTEMANKDDQFSKIILQNVPVLASAQATEQKDGKPAIVPTVTLDLIPSDAEKIIVGAKKGTLQLLLRNVIDTADVTTSGMTVSKALNRAEVSEVKPASTPHVKRTQPLRSEQSKQAQPQHPKVIMEIIEVSSKDTSSSIYKLH
jgi:pilus assembly protein CpaB